MKESEEKTTPDTDDAVQTLIESYRHIAKCRKALRRAMDSLESDVRARRVDHAEISRRLDEIESFGSQIEALEAAAESLFRKIGKHVE